MRRSYPRHAPDTGTHMKNSKILFELAIALQCALMLQGCGSGDSDPSSAATSVKSGVVSQVVVSPAQVSLAANGTQQFSATVSGSGDQSVVWMVDGVPGGAPGLGTISDDGVYTAPAGATKTLSATVTAVSQVMPLSSGAASVSVAAANYDSPVYVVSTTGNDSADGSPATPWRTIQHAVSVVPAGGTVQVEGGTYNELVTIARSGSATAGFITLTAAPGATATIDGTGLEAQDQQGLVTISNASYVRVIGLQLTNFTSNSEDSVPLGIYVNGSGHHIEIRDNHIHHISTTVESPAGSAFGLAVYGRGAEPISDLIIDGNEIDHLTTGYSESLTVNGNVANWQVTNNRVHDNNNIGIDAIGFEDTASAKGVNQARNGWIAGNVIDNVSSVTNPAYDGKPGAGGIYVDGGTRITIERNTVHGADLGIELASEHDGRVTSYVTARNNLVWNSNVTGISIGGYASTVGGTEHCTIVNNTLFENDTMRSGTGEYQIQYNARNNLFANNLLYANDQGVLVNSPVSGDSVPAAFQNNLYFTKGGAPAARWIWNDATLTTLSAFQQASGSEAAGVLADPRFVDVTTPDLHVAPGSPAIGTGIDLGALLEGIYDHAGSPRVVSGRVDRGAYQE
ncbi:right-handed parallel beta-helix repeat-containing protein [Burkholderia stabilis]|nr:right-handed parallel beta-helix repeat-containing protein [Burkholderia stabilis]